MQRVDVAASQTASGGDDVFGGEREVVDGAQDAAVGGLGHDHLLGIEIAKRIDGQAFGMQRGLDRRRDGRADRAQPGGGDVGHEHREQGAGVGHQQAFASVDPDQMGIPVGRAGFPDGRLRHPPAAPTPWRYIAASRVMIVGKATDDRYARTPGLAPVGSGDVLVADPGHFLGLPPDASGSARRLAQHLGYCPGGHRRRGR